ncbi:MAG: HEAT repeat protein [Planctomycetota bacterium]|jgi:HEAT repeat protein
MSRLLLLAWFTFAAFAVPSRATTPLLEFVAQESETEEITPQQIETAITNLRAAYAQKDESVLIEALAANRFPDSKVVALLSKGLGSKVQAVRQAALEALRWTPHKHSLRALHKECKRNSKLRSDEVLGPLLFKAIGQHGDSSSIPLLADQLYSVENRDIVRARILALGHIRDRKAVEALIDLQRAGKPGDFARAARNFRISLARLTSVDRGESAERWRTWWSDNKAKFEIPEKPPLLPKDLQRTWDSFWGVDIYQKRVDRREDRGND